VATDVDERVQALWLGKLESSMMQLSAIGRYMNCCFIESSKHFLAEDFLAKLLEFGL